MEEELKRDRRVVALVDLATKRAILKMAKADNRKESDFVRVILERVIREREET